MYGLPCGLAGPGGEAVTKAQLARFGDIHPLQVSPVLKVLKGRAWWSGRETDRMSGPSAWKFASPVWRRSAARCRWASVCSSACSVKGHPGGDLLAASLNPEQDPGHR